MSSPVSRREFLNLIAASICLPSSAEAAKDAALANGTASDGIEAGGFHFLDAEAVPDSVLEAVGRILDLGLPPPVIAFFRTVPIIIDPQIPVMPGRYEMTKYGWAVRIRPDGLAPDKPVLLHELLHAYHHRVLGLQNTQIKRAYSRALTAQGGDKRPYFLSNDREFFAVTGTIFLRAKIQQPPFDCGALMSDQVYLEFLTTLFGKGRC